MKELTDTRQQVKIKYKIWDILTVVVISCLCGMKTWEEIHDFVVMKYGFFRKFLKMSGGIPSAKTYERVMSIIDKDELKVIVLDFFKTITTDLYSTIDILNFDGRVNNGSKRKETAKVDAISPLNCLNVYSNNMKMCIAEEIIDKKTNVTPVEKNAIKEAAERTGAKKVFIEEEPKVAAVGVGLDISKPSGSMIVDIGGGTTDIAVLSLGSIVTSTSLKIAGNTFDNEIIKYVKDKYKLLIGEITAEEIKKKIGTVSSCKKEKMDVKGRNITTGLPHTIKLESEEVKNALKESIDEIIRSIKQVLENTPPELSADIINKGIVLTGGGAMVDGLDTLLKEELKVPIYIAESPLTCVAEGTGILLENLNLIDD